MIDRIVSFTALPETVTQNFTVLALTANGRLLTCGNDWNWYDVTPGESDDPEGEKEKAPE